MASHATTSISTSADVVIVGAGLAGLAAARHLHAAGVHAVILESSDDIGGRVRTDNVDGFTIDRGFQVLATAYPELRRVIALDDLAPRAFTRGLGIFGAGRLHRLVDPRQRPEALPDLLTLPLGSIVDRLRAARYAAQLLTTDAKHLLDQPDMSILDAFTASGLSQRTIDRVFRPFLSGILLEDQLTTSRRFVDLALRTMLRGDVVVPAAGMQALPRAIASPLPLETVRTGVDVHQVNSGVVVHSAGTTTARAIIVATDPIAAHTLVPSIVAPSMHAVTTLYHCADQSPLDDALLIVDGEQRLITNSIVLSNAAPEYAPAGRHLIATSVLGAGHDEKALDSRVRQRLSDLYQTSTTSWQLIATRAIAGALPAMQAPHDFRAPAWAADGVYVAGDHRDSSSIQGALVSGRRAATAVLNDLGLGSAPS